MEQPAKEMERSKIELAAQFLFESNRKLIFWGIGFLTAYFVLDILSELSAKAATSENISEAKQVFYGIIHWIGNFLSHIIRDIGISFFVAAFIRWAVELKAAEERNKTLADFKDYSAVMMEKISNNTLDSFFHKELPNNWYEYIRDSIRKYKIIRNNSIMTFSLKKPTAEQIDSCKKGDFLILLQEINYRLKNVSKDTISYDVEAFVEKSQLQLCREYEKLLMFKVGSCDYAKLLGNTDSGQALIVTEETDYIKYSHRAEIPASAEIEVSIMIQSVRKTEDTYAWVALMPSIGIDIYAKTTEGYVVRLCLMHAQYPLDGNMYQYSINDIPAHASTDDPVLPYTAAELYWRPNTCPVP